MTMRLGKINKGKEENRSLGAVSNDAEPGGSVN